MSRPFQGLSEADGLMDIDVPLKELGEVEISPVKRAALALSDDDRLIVVH